LGSQQSLAEDLSRFYGITLKWKRTSNEEEAWNVAKKKLDSNEPLIVGVDVYHLEYHHQYQRVHGVYYIILSGYDEKKNKVYVIYGYPPRFFKGTVSIKSLKQARNSLNPKEPDHPRFSGFSIENRWLDIKYPFRQIELDNNLIKKIVLENIRAMLEANNKKDYFQGIRGIRTFAEDILEWTTHDNKDLLMTKMEKSFYYLRGIKEQRISHLQFLSTISEKLRKPELGKISKELTKIFQSWIVVRAMFFKASKKESETILPRIRTRLLDIADREEKVLLKLKDIILSC